MTRINPWEATTEAQDTLAFQLHPRTIGQVTANDTAETSDAKPPASTGVSAAFSDASA